VPYNLSPTTIRGVDGLSRDFAATGIQNGYRDLLTALIDRRVMTRVVAEIDLARPRDFLLGVEEHLFPLGDPS
jgi:hypothetical protein